MRKYIAVATVAASMALAGGASAQYGPAPCAPACPPAQQTYVIPNVTPCYRTTTQPCLNPVQGVAGVLGKIFAPACFDTCKPCNPCY